MSDLIERQSLREQLNELCDKKCPYNEPTKAIGACCSSCAIDDVIEIVQNLPSAEPEIIYCGDCKYKDDGIDEDGIPFLKCLNGRSYGGTRINDYCSWAERRTDEGHDL